MASEKKSLPFIYQFGAGAVAGVSEVRQQIWNILFYMTLSITTSSSARLIFSSEFF